MPTITDAIREVQTNIVAACERAERDPQSVTLIGVSKTKPAAQLIEAAEAGLQHFGENRVEESNDKIPTVNAALEQRPIWHMIGHLQSRKTADLFRGGAPLFDLVHSVDSVKLAGRLSRLREEHGSTLDILLQMNVSGEVSKEGFDAVGWSSDETVRALLWQEFSAIHALPGLNVRGLMTIAPIANSAEEVRPIFSDLRRLRDALAESFAVALPELSMGMTDDYAVAVEEGATLVRVGRAIFGER